jgi:hypothetical protein
MAVTSRKLLTVSNLMLTLIITNIDLLTLVLSMIMIIMQPKFSTFSRTSLQSPHEEIRESVNVNSPWFRFVEEHQEILKIYNLIVNHILSDISPLHLNDLRNILKFQYCSPYELVEDTIQFMVQVPTKHIEFEMRENSNIRLPLIYKKPRKHVEIVGEYSVFVPSKDLKVQPYDGLER